MLNTTQDTNKLEHTRNTSLNTSEDTNASADHKTCVSIGQKKKWCFNRTEGTYVFKHTGRHIYVLKHIGRHGCVHIHQQTFVLKQETTFVLTHVLLNTENTNVLKHIRRYMCSSTPEDTGVLKYSRRYTCNNATKKTRMCLNTSEDTEVLKNIERHLCLNTPTDTDVLKHTERHGCA